MDGFCSTSQESLQYSKSDAEHADPHPGDLKVHGAEATMDEKTVTTELSDGRDEESSPASLQLPGKPRRQVWRSRAKKAGSQNQRVSLSGLRRPLTPSMSCISKRKHV